MSWYEQRRGGLGRAETVETRSEVGFLFIRAGAGKALGTGATVAQAAVACLGGIGISALIREYGCRRRRGGAPGFPRSYPRLALARLAALMSLASSCSK